MVVNFLKSTYQKVKQTFAKTGSLLGDKIRSIFKGDINPNVLEKLEKLLYEADLGVEMAEFLTQKVKESHKNNARCKAEEVLEEIRKDILDTFPPTSADPIHIPQTGHPFVILIVGVNGNGKTTSVAKLAKNIRITAKKS